MKIRVLLCERDVDMALRCIGSYFAFGRDRFEASLIIHDDGSLSERSKDRLRAALPIHSTVGRREADAAVSQALRGFPRLLNERCRNIFLLKFVDVNVLERDDQSGDGFVRILDSDILFLRPFKNAFEQHPAFDFTCMQDARNGYSPSAYQCAVFRRFPVLERVNAGLVQMRVDLWDPEYLERILGDARMFGRPVFIEQTLWAILGQRGRAAVLDPGQVTFMQRGTQPHHRRIAAHFVTPCRDLLANWPDEASGAEEPMEVIRRPLPGLSPRRYFIGEMVARIRGEFAIFRRRLMRWPFG